MFNVNFDTRAFQRAAAGVERAQKQLRFATAVALTKSMQDARAAEQATMKSVFDRPSPYTLGAMQVKPATKDNLRAEIGFKEGFGGTPAWKYLGPEVAGGTRRAKASERALRTAGILKGDEFIVPGPGIKLNSYGNVTGSQMTAILSALGASTDAMQNRNRTRKTKAKRTRADYFVVRTKGKAGIYMRKGRDIVPVLLFVRSPSYKPRFPYYQVANRTIPAAFKRHMRENFQRYVMPALRAG